MRFSADLTQRQQAIFAEYKEFQGEKTVEELSRILKLGRSRIYEEISQIRTKLIRAVTPVSIATRDKAPKRIGTRQ